VYVLREGAIAVAEIREALESSTGAYTLVGPGGVAEKPWSSSCRLKSRRALV
jgi:hypothetical protein